MTPAHDPIFLVFMLVVVSYLVAVVLLSNRLKRYPDAWERTGRFLLVMNNTPITGIKFLKFVFSDAYRTLSDQFITVMVWVVRVLFGIAMIFFAIQVMRIFSQ